MTTKTFYRIGFLLLSLFIGQYGNVLSAQALFNEQLILEEFNGATCIAAADFNADGLPDFTATSNNGHKVSWFEQGNGFQFIEHVIVTGYTKAKGVIAARIDNNDSWDIVATAKTLGRFSWFANDGSGNFTEHLISDSTWTSADFVYAEDIDSDGDQDLILISCDDNRIAWAENDGNGQFTVADIKLGWTKVNWATVYDLDDDGNMDVLATAKAGQLIWFVNDGDQQFTEVILVDSVQAINSVQVADLDADGDPDLAATACGNTDKVMWYENDGNFGFTEHVLKTGYNGGRASRIADLDQDGDPDILSIAWETGVVHFWENDGSGQFSERLLSDDAYDMIQVHVADMDLDGDPDILGACFGSHEIRWWENIRPFMVPGFKATPQTGQKPMQVEFTDETYANPQVHSWFWDFNNDGIVDSQEQNPTHTFETKGNYTVKLVTVSDSVSDSIIREQVIRVFDGESSLEFNGTDSRVKCSQINPLDLRGNFTLEAWVKPEGFGTSGAGKVFDKTMFSLFVNQHSASLAADSSYAVMMAMANGTVTTFTTSAQTVNTGMWQHIALTYDTLSGEALFFLNGISQPLEMDIVPEGPLAANGSREMVLGNTKTGNLAFEGCIDEVRLWNTIRTEEEINEWMERNLPESQEGLLGYWKMNEGVGDTLGDLSGNNRFGPLSNAAWAQGVDLSSVGIPGKPGSGAGALTLVVYPNPLSGEARIRYRIPSGREGRLQLISSSGKVVEESPVLMTATEGKGEAGWKELFSIQPEGLIPGLYLLCLQTPQNLVCSRVIVGGDQKEKP